MLNENSVYANGQLKQSALQYARFGFHIFPLIPNSKKPRKGSKGYLDATTDHTQITEWWDENPRYNIGIATGKVSNICVMDLDVAKQGKRSGRETYLKLIEDNGRVSETLVVKTPRGGYHYYFRYPNKPVINSVGLFEGIDSRGDGGYIVAPPSYIIDRQEEIDGGYHIVRGDITKIGLMPSWWYEKVVQKKDYVVVTNLNSYEFNEEEYLNGSPILEGKRDNTLY